MTRPRRSDLWTEQQVAEAHEAWGNYRKLLEGEWPNTEETQDSKVIK